MPVPAPTRRLERRQIRGVTWLLVEHPANIRRNSHTSRIWDHGGQYLNLQTSEIPHSWICDHCDSIIKLARSQSSWNISRHLRRAHQIRIKRENSEVEEEEQETTQGTHIEGFRALVTMIDIERFRRLLVRWIVQGQIPFSAVKLAQFKDLLVCLQPGIERYLIHSHSTMKSWVDSEYTRARQQLKARINTSLSRIHLSFDIWTSPSYSAVVGVCAHFLSPNLSLTHALLGLKELVGAHQGESIAELVSKLILYFEIQDKIGVYVGDNAGNVDTAVKALVREFHSDESEQGRRSRCCGHIINLAAKAFLLGTECEAFEDEIDAAEQATMRDEQNLVVEQAKWRSRGPIGKFHNVVAYIRATSQRRQEFQAAIQLSIDQAQRRGESSFSSLLLG